MLQSISLEHFRNYEQKTFSFGEGIQVLQGNNGVGKTNVIEAIYALATGRPFRSSQKEVFLRHESPYGRISGTWKSNSEGIALGEGDESLSIFWQVSPTSKTAYFWNDIALSAGEYLRRKSFFAVLFSPEEMNLPFFPPKYRRSFLDRLLSPLFPEYFEAASKYAVTLKHRNQLLHRAQEERVPPEEFSFWDSELVKWESVISQKREDFFRFANERLSSAYQFISGKEEPLFLSFLPSADRGISFQESLHLHFLRDKMRGSTSIGPHRDDFQILLRGFPVEENASRGETRSALLALKALEREFIAFSTKRSPILLLDDVFSELDRDHQEHLLQSLPHRQTILTTTDMGSLHDVYSGAVHLL